MKQIFQEVSLNKGGIGLYRDIYLDGKQIEKDVKCESLLQNFLLSLFIQMSGYKNQLKSRYLVSGTNITGATNATPIVITTSTSHGLSTGHFVRISGVLGNTAANGDWGITYLGTYTFSLAGSVGNGVYISGGVVLRKVDDYIVPSANNFRIDAGGSDMHQGIVIGAGSGSVALDNWALANLMRTGIVTYGTNAISVPAIDATSQTITITRQFTNNSGVSQTVYEIGLALHSSTATGYLSARDVIPAGIIIPNGKTLTVNYKIKTVLGTTGGFVRQLFDLLYRHIAGVTYDAKDIDGATRNYSRVEYADFICNVGGGLGSISDLPTCPLNYQIGVSVGTGINAVSMTDFGLQTVIIHGTITNRLFYHGNTVVMPILEAGQTYFDIVRILENKSGGSIIVKEVGLNVGAGSTYGYLRMAHQILRNTLIEANWVTLVNGEYLKATYRIKIVL